MTSSKSGILLSSGYFMPLVGLGTWQSTNEKEVEDALEAAIDAGYRHIDTAAAYGNEKLLGRILKKFFESGKVQRSDLFIVTKLPGNGMRNKNVEHFLRKSLSALQLDYIDLYLVHSPLSSIRTDNDEDFWTIVDGVFQGDHGVDLTQTWAGMEALVDQGLVRSIGLSNFNSKQIQRIVDNARIQPSNLQVECHAYLPQLELQEFCKTLNISFTAYSPLGSPGLAGYKDEKYGITVEDAGPKLLADPKVKEIAEKHNKTSGQILLRFLVQRGISAIPKSANPQRIKENIDLFDFNLTEEDMEELKSLKISHRYFSLDIVKGTVDHPEYPFKEPF